MLRWLFLGTLGLTACRSTKPTLDEGVPDTAALTVDADADGYDSTEDCDDNNSVVHPGAAEVCDGIDNDCDGITDEGVTTTFYADTDGDGFGDADSPTEACEAPDGYVPNGNDCNDASALDYPGAAERCDGIDNDCDTLVDEDVTTTFYADTDGDGFGDPDAAVDDCDPGSGYVSDSTDCDDATADANPDAEEVCDSIDNDCDGSIDEGVTTTYYQDTDADSYGLSDATTEACALPTGYAERPGDCDDTDGAVRPDAEEVCNTIDDDCDGSIDEGVTTTYYADTDSDGYGDAADSTDACSTPSGYVSDDTDCDDTEAAANPGEAEVCDRIDNDCDGSTDEGVTTTYYADDDADGYGDAADTADACAAPSGYVEDDTDCDDAEAAANPGEAEVCDEIDNDCDGTTDEGVTTTYYADDDADGFGDAADATEACSQPSGTVSDSTDCDDAEAAANPDEDEVCDGIDNDCDGVTDEDDAVDAPEWYADDDGDGYGDAADATAACSQPSGAVSDSTDCDDDEAAANPGEAEVCDSIDNDCDGSIDEGVTTTYYVDDDGDGYGDADEGSEDCEAPSGYVEDDTDCDDGDADRNPGEEDLCDGEDNDCDDEVDEDAVADAYLASLYGGTFYVLDPDDGSYSSAFSPSTSSTGTYSANGIASSLSGGGVYIHDSGDSRLLELDVCDESIEEIGETNVGNTCGIAFGPDDELYGIDTSNDTLVVYDTSTGEATDVGDLGFNLRNCALTYDCATDTLVGMQVNPSDGTGYLFSIDVETGEATELVDLDSDVDWGSAGLQYAPTEALYYASTDDGVFEVDISDGEATEVVSLATNNLSYIVDTCE